MGYLWNDFGVLIDVVEDEKIVTVINSESQIRKMAVYRYHGSARNVAHKARKLIGYYVTLRTSQNTDKWSPDVWFSDIELAG